MSNFIKDFITFHLGAVDKQMFMELAKKSNIKAFRIYRLTKGQKTRLNKEIEILYELRERGFISGIRYRYRY